MIYQMILKVNANCFLMTHLLFVVHDNNSSANSLNRDLEKTSESAFQFNEVQCRSHQIGP